MSLSKLTNIINNRIVCIMVHGASIERLEDTIESLKDYNLCWASLGLFTTMEDYILNKINKKLDIVMDCSTVAEHLQENYEENIRLPRIQGFLERNMDNLWITTHGLIRDVVSKRRPQWLEIYKDKIFEVDNLFPKDNLSFYMSVPNSLTLFTAAIIAGQASKIILFGCDGYIDSANNLHTYYKAMLQRKERYNALGYTTDDGIVRDSKNFELRFDGWLENYKKLFNNNMEIVNCSPNSIYTHIKKIDYYQLLFELNRK
jgi:hypothetical protein